MCVGPTCSARAVASYLTNRTLYGHKRLLLATAVSFFWDSDPLECALFRKGEKGILQGGNGVRGQQGKKSKENQEFWVLRHHPHDQEIPAAPGLCKSAFAQQEVGPGGIFSNPSHYFKGKFTSSTKRLVAPSDKRIALGRGGRSKLLLTPGCGLGRGNMGE